MTEFVKLYGSILYSTVWLEPLPTKVIWITMLALADWEGLVAASVPGLAKIAGVDREDCEAALLTLLSPDPDSKTKEDEGRRIREVDGGWKIINHGKYRDMRTENQVKTAQRVKQYRDKAKALHVTDVTPSNAKKRTVTRVTPDKDKDKETTSAKAEYAFMGSMRTVWKTAYGGSIPSGSAKLLKQPVSELGEEEVARRLAVYCNATEGQYASIPRFANTIGTWAEAKRNGSDPALEQFRKRGYLL